MKLKCLNWKEISSVVGRKPHFWEIVIILALFGFSGNGAFGNAEALVGSGQAEVFRGDVLLYATAIDATVAEDGRFVYKVDRGYLYPERQVTLHYDGNDFFCIVSGNDDERGFAYINSDSEGVPMVAFQDLVRNALWLALGSGHYVRQNGLVGEMPNVLSLPRQYVTAWGFRYEAELLEGRFPLVSDFSLFRDESLDANSLRGEELRPGLDLSAMGSDVRAQEIIRRSEIADGSLALTLMWENEVILGDQQIPNEITIMGSPQNSRRFVVKLSFDSWEIADREDSYFRPAIRETIYVEDSRLRRRNETHYVDSINYVVGPTAEISDWPRADAAWLVEAFEAGMQPIPVEKDSPVGVILLVLILFVAVALPALLFWFHTKDKKEM